MEYGYARVSTAEQNEGRQMMSLLQFGIQRENIFLDKVSGKNFDRAAYKELIGILKEGDTLVVESIDRLGRNYDDITRQWRIITKDIGAYVVVQDMPVLDTRRDKDLTFCFIADVVLQLLSYVAQKEREMILKRQAEGIEVAKKNGVRFGRKPLDRPERFEEMRARWLRGEISSREAARQLDVNHSTFYHWARNT